MGGGARGHRWIAAWVRVGRRRSMGGVARGYRWSGAGIWAEWRRGMGGAAQGGWEERRRGIGGVALGDGWSDARGWAECGGTWVAATKKDAVLKGRTRRLQTLNSVWKGNYCSGIGDGGAIKSTKQREASAVPYRFVMVIPSVMKLSSPK